MLVGGTFPFVVASFSAFGRSLVSFAVVYIYIYTYIIYIYLYKHIPGTQYIYIERSSSDMVLEARGSNRYTIRGQAQALVLEFTTYRTAELYPYMVALVLFRRTYYIYIYMYIYYVVFGDRLPSISDSNTLQPKCGE